MKEVLGNFYFEDHQLKSVEHFNDVFLSTGINVYEVLRQSHGIPIFLEQHIVRLNNSARGKSLCGDFNLTEIKNEIAVLAEKNNFPESNIKIVYHSGDSGDCSIYIYPVDFFYPSEKDYREGVRLISLIETRPDPNLKNWRPAFREKIRKLKAREKVFEILLINESGLVTEGSQSNLFFIRDNRLYTAQRKNVLPGITREYVLRIAAGLHTEVYEMDFRLEDLFQAECIFITGTSPKILPVSSVNERTFNPDHPILRQLVNEYDLLIRNYLKLNA